MFREPETSGQNLRWQECLASVARSRDQQAFMVFYDHFAPRLNGWLLRRTGDMALTEELVQETMLIVWRKAHLYDSRKAAPGTWLFRIARNLYVDHLRRTGSTYEEDCLLVEPAASDPELQPDTGMLRDALKQLPFQQAQVIYMSYFEGKSHRQIADELDMPLGSVKSSLRLAFHKLSRLLGTPA